MALRDRLIPPTINLENPEPDLGIDIDESEEVVVILAKLKAWEARQVSGCS